MTFAHLFTPLFGARASRQQRTRDAHHRGEHYRQELAQWEAEGGNVAPSRVVPNLYRRLPERPDQPVNITGAQRHHVAWKEREIVSGSRPLADLSLDQDA